MQGGRSSAGRAPDLHSGGRRFDPDRLHQSGRTYIAHSSGRLEHCVDNAGVGGSSPPGPTTFGSVNILVL